MRIVAGVFAGAALGAFAGLLVATLVNANCDSFLEQVNGCLRLRVGVMAFYGSSAGATVGAIVGALWHGARRPKPWA